MLDTESHVAGFLCQRHVWTRQPAYGVHPWRRHGSARIRGRVFQWC